MPQLFPAEADLPDQVLDEPEMRAWTALLWAHGEITRTLDAELTAEAGLSLSAYGVLLILAHSPKRRRRMSELAELTQITRSGTPRVVDHLQSKGWVERVRCPTDARGYLAVLTDVGLDALRKAAPIHLRGVKEHFTTKLSEGQLQGVAEGLEAALSEQSTRTRASLVSSLRSRASR